MKNSLIVALLPLVFLGCKQTSINSTSAVQETSVNVGSPKLTSFMSQMTEEVLGWKTPNDVQSSIDKILAKKTDGMSDKEIAELQFMQAYATTVPVFRGVIQSFVPVFQGQNNVHSLLATSLRTFVNRIHMNFGYHMQALSDYVTQPCECKSTLGGSGGVMYTANDITQIQDYIARVVMPASQKSLQILKNIASQWQAKQTSFEIIFDTRTLNFDSKHYSNGFQVNNPRRPQFKRLSYGDLLGIISSWESAIGNGYMAMALDVSNWKDVANQFNQFVLKEGLYGASGVSNWEKAHMLRQGSFLSVRNHTAMSQALQIYRASVQSQLDAVEYFRSHPESPERDKFNVTEYKYVSPGAEDAVASLKELQGVLSDQGGQIIDTMTGQMVPMNLSVLFGSADVSLLDFLPTKFFGAASGNKRIEVALNESPGASRFPMPLQDNPTAKGQGRDYLVGHGAEWNYEKLGLVFPRLTTLGCRSTGMDDALAETCRNEVYRSSKIVGFTLSSYAIMGPLTFILD